MNHEEKPVEENLPQENQEEENQDNDEEEEEEDLIANLSKEEAIELANKKEAEAKELMKQRQYGEASDLFSDVLNIRTRLFGELASECAESYFNYGQCLLFSAQSQFDVLGAVMKKSVEKTFKKQQGIEDDDPILGSDDEEQSDAPTAQSVQESFDTAYEVLELARVIYEKNPDDPLALAEVYLTLGDLNMELDDMKRAANEYTECLKLRQYALPPDDRKIAEAHFFIGMAYSYINDAKLALDHFGNAKSILEIHLARHKNESTPESAEKAKEIEEVLTDLSIRMEEFQTPNPMAFVKKELEQTKTESGPNAFGTSTMKDSSAPIQNLGVFGRKKTPSVPQVNGNLGPIKRKAEALSTTK